MPPPPPGPVPARRQRVIQKDYRSIRPNILFSQNERGQKSYVRLSTTWGKYWSDGKAVCALHGANCRQSRSMRSGRPLGLLWAWLKFGEDPSVTSKEQHDSYQPTFEVRCEARREFEELGDAVHEFLSAESGGPGLGEPFESK